MLSETTRTPRRLAVTRRLAVNTQFSSNYPVTSFIFIGIVFI